LLLGQKDFSTRNSRTSEQIFNHVSIGSSTLNWKVVNAEMVLRSTSKTPATGQYMNKRLHESCTGSYENYITAHSNAQNGH
jgi:hypothetical protein